MGDGRIYTYTQFFDVLYFMIYIIVLTAICISIYYRNKKTKTIRNIMMIFVFAFIMALSRFIEAVTYREEFGYYLRLISCICMTSIISYTMKLFLIKYEKFLKYISFLYLILPLITIFIKDNVINQYSFEKIDYSTAYVVYIFIGIIIMVMQCIVQAILNNTKSEKVICLSIIIPSVIYLVDIIWINMELHYYIALLSVLVIYFVLLNHIPTQVVSGVFDNIEKYLDDIIFLTNENGLIIHSNKDKQELKQFFNIEKTIDVFAPYNIFKEKIIRKSKERIRYELEILTGGDIRFFSMNSYELKNKGKLIGYLFVIREFTKTANMLNELSKKKDDLENINKELKDYSEVVYKYETEKGIQNLMHEINDRLGHQIIELSIVTHKAYDETINNSHMTENSIDEVISEAKSILQDVRIAVAKYRYLHEE